MILLYSRNLNVTTCLFRAEYGDQVYDKRA
uniref:Uncharacterized protein n=1 Tax=Rhizophora mucronata TaxID=61149 RepID=A0A2P2LT17_RHIMU